MIYLDNSATTRPNEACVAAMNELLTECWFNPSSVYRPGMDAAHRLKTARAQVAQALGAETERVFFTSGGTEADNWAIFSTAKRLGKRGQATSLRPPWSTTPCCIRCPAGGTGL